MSGEQAEIIVHNSLNDIDRLQDLVENLLLSAQLDGKKYELQFFETNLTELINEVVRNFANPRGLSSRMVLNLEDQIIAWVDPTAIEMIVNNLLTNAFKYSGGTSLIFIDLRQNKGETILRIADQGPGIPDEDKKDLFTKFFRVGDENTRKTKGTGLGLFIVKNLVDLHKADISVMDNQPNGTIFEIRFKPYEK